MLVLSRSKGEKVKIGDSIEIVVTEIGHRKVLLGIECPKDILILRSELELADRNAGKDVEQNRSL